MKQQIQTYKLISKLSNFRGLLKHLSEDTPTVSRRSISDNLFVYNFLESSLQSNFTKHSFIMYNFAFSIKALCLEPTGERRWHRFIYFKSSASLFQFKRLSVWWTGLSVSLEEEHRNFNRNRYCTCMMLSIHQSPSVSYHVRTMVTLNVALLLLLFWAR